MADRYHLMLVVVESAAIRCTWHRQAPRGYAESGPPRPSPNPASLSHPDPHCTWPLHSGGDCWDLGFVTVSHDNVT